MNNTVFSASKFRTALSAFFAGRFFQAVANLALMLLIVRVLDQSDYGAYMMLRGLIELLVPLSSLGLLESTRRYMPDLASRGSSIALRKFVQWTTIARLIILLIWTISIALLWPELTEWLGFSAVQTDQTWMGIWLVISTLSFRYGAEMLEALLEQRWSQTARTLLPLGSLIGVATMITFNVVSLERVIILDLTVALFCLVIVQIALTYKLNQLKLDGTYSVSAREVFSFSWHMAGAVLLNSVSNIGVLRMLVARMLGLEAAGFFAFLQQLLTMLSRYMPAQLLANIVRPMLISRHTGGDAQIVPNSMALMWKSNMLIVIACIAWTAVVGDQAIAWFSGGKFQHGGWVAVALLVGLGAIVQQQIISMLMQIHDRTQLLRNLSFLFLLEPLAFWLGSHMSLLIASVFLGLTQWLNVSFAHWILNKNNMNFHTDWPGVIRYALVVSVIATIPLLVITYITGTHTNFWLSPLIFALIIIGTYIAKPISLTEGTALSGLLKNKYRFVSPIVHDQQSST